MTVSNTGWDTISPELTKTAFELWIELGSLQRVQAHMQEQGYRNSMGKPYPVSHINALANRYMLESYGEVDIKGIIDADLASLGKPPMTQEEFEKFLMQKAITLWGKRSHKKRFFAWVEKHGFQKYQRMWIEQGVPAVLTPTGRPSSKSRTA